MKRILVASLAVLCGCASVPQAVGPVPQPSPILMLQDEQESLAANVELMRAEFLQKLGDMLSQPELEAETRELFQSEIEKLQAQIRQAKAEANSAKTIAESSRAEIRSIQSLRAPAATLSAAVSPGPTENHKRLIELLKTLWPGILLALGVPALGSGRAA